MATVNITSMEFNNRSVTVKANLVLLNDKFEVRLPFPVQAITSIEIALGTTSAATTVVRGTNVIGSDGKGVSFQTLQTLSTLATPASASTHIVRVIEVELTALTGVGGVEVTFVGAAD